MAAWAKLITVFASLSIGVAGGISAYNNWIVGKHESEKQMQIQSQEFERLQDNFELVIDSINGLSRQIRVVDRKVESVNSKTDYLMQSNNNLKSFMINNAVSTDDVIEIIEIWDVKKKSRNSSEGTASSR